MLFLVTGPTRYPLRLCAHPLVPGGQEADLKLMSREM